VATVRKWADSGALQAFRTPGGQRRFWSEDVEKFLNDQEPAA
jgi:excisionase family DNA binding protein